ncbi:MAG: adenylate/guanylate cyclase domain-containing protein [Candidatus Dadabacteria bacterium]|nr:adenylate/guanylate cyclase domain-containing protein [Candidatus Dadabacteria bacterium]
MNNKKRKHYRPILLFVLGTFVVVNAIFLLVPSVPDILSLRLNDQLYKLRSSIKGPEHVWGTDGGGRPLIILIELDDSGYDMLEELKERYGERVFDADVINILSAAEVEVIGYDEVFVIEGGDELVDATIKAGNVFYPVIMIPGDAENQLYNVPDFKSNLWNFKTSGKSPPEHYIRFATKPEIAQGSRGIAQINISPDIDGIFRRVPLIIRTKDGYFPTLGLLMAADYLEVGPAQMEVVFGKYMLLRDAKYPDGIVKDIKLPIDDQGRMIINFAGNWLDVYRHIRKVDILEVLEDEDLIDILKDDVAGGLAVVADVSSAGSDFEAVPINKQYPLSSVHANILNSILTDNFIRELPGWQVIVINLLISIIICITAIKTRAFVFFVSTFLVFCVYLLFVTGLFVYGNTLMNAIPAAVAIVFSFMLVSIYRYLQEEQEKMLLYQTFESYFAPSVMNKILKEPDKLESSERKVLTVLFSDISGFTAWSSTREPEEIHSTLNEYYGEMARIVFKYEGTIDKYMGDGMMVFFGDPLEYEDHALRAVKTAVEMQQKGRELKERWKSQGRLQIRMRIGINTGEVVVGNMGSENRIEYTVLGSNVNLAQRLEDNAPIEGILISESVYQELKREEANDSSKLSGIETKSYGNINIKGLSEEIHVYQVLC